MNFMMCWIPTSSCTANEMQLEGGMHSRERKTPEEKPVWLPKRSRFSLAMKGGGYFSMKISSHFNPLKLNNFCVTKIIEFREKKMAKKKPLKHKYIGKKSKQNYSNPYLSSWLLLEFVPFFLSSWLQMPAESFQYISNKTFLPKIRKKYYNNNE